MLVAQDDVQKLQTNFDALKNKMNDKLNHFTQLAKTATVPSPQINPDTPMSVCSKPVDEQVNLEKALSLCENGYKIGETASSQHSYAVLAMKSCDASTSDGTINNTAPVINETNLSEKSTLITQGGGVLHYKFIHGCAAPEVLLNLVLICREASAIVADVCFAKFPTYDNAGKLSSVMITNHR
eukprot:Seg222.13 transcript_id=Seg222.13/GoldUCD/mRNA.D3Y31 product="hypothetical protein" protein_id=Seg222.13/GoldUCD/D3Y31